MVSWQWWLVKVWGWAFWQGEGEGECGGDVERKGPRGVVDSACWVIACFWWDNTGSNWWVDCLRADYQVWTHNVWVISTTYRIYPNFDLTWNGDEMDQRQISQWIRKIVLNYNILIFIYIYTLFLFIFVFNNKHVISHY